MEYTLSKNNKHSNIVYAYKDYSLEIIFYKAYNKKKENLLITIIIEKYLKLVFIFLYKNKIKYILFIFFHINYIL